jgi:hypothetical protein
MQGIPHTTYYLHVVLAEIAVASVVCLPDVLHRLGLAHGHQAGLLGILDREKVNSFIL